MFGKRKLTESLVVDLRPMHPALGLLELPLERGRGAAVAAALRVHDGACAQVPQLVQLDADTSGERHRLGSVALEMQDSQGQNRQLLHDASSFLQSNFCKLVQFSGAVLKETPACAFESAPSPRRNPQPTNAVSTQPSPPCALDPQHEHVVVQPHSLLAEQSFPSLDLLHLGLPFPWRTHFPGSRTRIASAGRRRAARSWS